jgi:TetR/AcrR family transcriptional regulator, fatty acid metabolism regulator protein
LAPVGNIIGRPIKKPRPADDRPGRHDGAAGSRRDGLSPKIGVAPQRRAQIVRATIQCLARDGYGGLTMKRVAREAGLSQGILHYYFQDKGAMLVAALHAVAVDMDRRVAAAQARGGRDARARLRALIAACLETAVTDRELWAVFVEFWGEAMHDRRLRAVNAALYTRMRRLIGRLVAEGTRAGAFRRLDPASAAAIILGLVDGVALQLTFDPDALAVSAATRACDDALARYLRAVD